MNTQGSTQGTADENIYAKPQVITDIGECYFYHTIDIPGYGVVKGEWDLRGEERAYLGDVNFKGKRVLEVGTASGFLCFYMESQGAEVVAYDLSENQSWDIVPYCQYNNNQIVSERKSHIRKINNAFWLSHRAYNSQAKMVYGTVYTIPEQIGMVDISTFGSILFHVRDPFLALQSALCLTKETVIITEPLTRGYFLFKFLDKLRGPCMQFLPEPKICSPIDTWWRLSPDIIIRFLTVLGFEEVTVKYHLFKGHKECIYAIVGHRTRDMQPR